MKKIFAVKVISWMVMNMTTDECIEILKTIEKDRCTPIIPAYEHDAIELAIEALKRDKWISVSEKLPEPNHYVLIKKTDGDFTVGEYLGTEFPIQDAWFFANGEYNGRTKDIKEWKELE